MRSMDRTLVITGLGVLVLVIVALVLVLAGPGEEELDPGSPEGVVQRYLKAVIDGDESEAIGLLRAPRSCDDRGPIYQEPGDLRATLGSVDVDGDQATVVLLVTTSTGAPPFDGSGYTSEERFTLDRVAGSWQIDSVPWRFEVCKEEAS